MPRPDATFMSDMAQLSEQSYRRDGGIPPLGWQKISVYRPDAIVPIDEFSYDYQIVAYKHDATHTVTLAYRGTVPTSLSNWVRDDIGHIGLGNSLKSFSSHPYSSFARDIYEQVTMQFPGYTVTHTGHSLGAAIATLQAATRGEKAVVFESPGVQGIIDNNPTLKQTIQQQLNKANCESIHIVLNIPNAINKFGVQLRSGHVERINPYRPDNMPLAINPFRGHSMGDIAEYFKSQAGKKTPSSTASITSQLQNAQLPSTNEILQINSRPTKKTKPMSQADKTFLGTNTMDAIAPPQVQTKQPSLLQSLLTNVAIGLTAAGISNALSSLGNTTLASDLNGTMSGDATPDMTSDNTTTFQPPTTTSSPPPPPPPPPKRLKSINIVPSAPDFMNRR